MVYNIFIIILCIIIIFLSIKLHKKIVVDSTEINDYKHKIENLKEQKEDLQKVMYINE